MTKSNTWCDRSDRWILACKYFLICLQWTTLASMATLSIGHRELWPKSAYLLIRKESVCKIVSWDNLKMWDVYHSGLWQAPWGLRTATKESSAIFETFHVYNLFDITQVKVANSPARLGLETTLKPPVPITWPVRGLTANINMKKKKIHYFSPQKLGKEA